MANGKVSNSYGLGIDISSIYNIYKNRAAKGSDFLSKINGAFNASADNPGGMKALDNLTKILEGASDTAKVGDLISLNGLNIGYQTDAPTGNYISGQALGTSEYNSILPPIQDKVSIIGKDNSLESFLAGGATGSNSILSGGGSSSSAGGGGGGSGSYSTGGGGSGTIGGSAGSGSILSAALGSAGNIDSSTNVTNPAPSLGTPASQTQVSSAVSTLESNISKKLKLASRTSRIDGILTNLNLRQQTLIGR